MNGEFNNDARPPMADLMGPSSHLDAPKPEFRAFMYNTTGQYYDKELQMFRDAVREPDYDQLRFLRWLADQGKLEHRTFGPSVGEMVKVGEYINQGSK